MAITKLLTVSNTKTLKGEKQGYMTFILHLAPAAISGHEVCPKASAGCRMACLNTAGRGRFDNVQSARIRKTREFFQDRAGFLAELVADVERAIRHASRKGLTPVFRLNGTSDLPWEKFKVTRGGQEFRNIMRAFPDVQFYDYTKIAGRKNLPDNYALTFSLAEDNDLDALRALDHGHNVAVVFDSLPEFYMGRPVINGDESDLRFLDPQGVVVGLKAKGEAKHDRTGFVRRAVVLEAVA